MNDRKEQSIFIEEVYLVGGRCQSLNQTLDHLKQVSDGTLDIVAPPVQRASAAGGGLGGASAVGLDEIRPGGIDRGGAAGGMVFQ